MVVIKTEQEVENVVVDLYHTPVGGPSKLIGPITSGLILLDVCVQIKEAGAEGYSIKFEGFDSLINKTGRLITSGGPIPYRKLGEMLRVII